jgi:hypothetical protein
MRFRLIIRQVPSKPLSSVPFSLPSQVFRGFRLERRRWIRHLSVNSRRCQHARYSGPIYNPPRNQSNARDLHRSIDVHRSTNHLWSLVRLFTPSPVLRSARMRELGCCVRHHRQEPDVPAEQLMLDSCQVLPAPYTRLPCQS